MGAMYFFFSVSRGSGVLPRALAIWQTERALCVTIVSLLVFDSVSTSVQERRLKLMASVVSKGSRCQVVAKQFLFQLILSGYPGRNPEIDGPSVISSMKVGI